MPDKTPENDPVEDRYGVPASKGDEPWQPTEDDENALDALEFDVFGGLLRDRHKNGINLQQPDTASPEPDPDEGQEFEFEPPPEADEPEIPSGPPVASDHQDAEAPDMQAPVPTNVTGSAEPTEPGPANAPAQADPSEQAPPEPPNKARQAYEQRQRRHELDQLAKRREKIEAIESDAVREHWLADQQRKEAAAGMGQDAARTSPAANPFETAPDPAMTGQASGEGEGLGDKLDIIIDSLAVIQTLLQAMAGNNDEQGEAFPNG